MAGASDYYDGWKVTRFGLMTEVDKVALGLTLPPLTRSCPCSWSG